MRLVGDWISLSSIAESVNSLEAWEFDSDSAHAGSEGEFCFRFRWWISDFRICYMIKKMKLQNIQENQIMHCCPPLPIIDHQKCSRYNNLHHVCTLTLKVFSIHFASSLFIYFQLSRQITWEPSYQYLHLKCTKFWKPPSYGFLKRIVVKDQL